MRRDITVRRSLREDDSGIVLILATIMLPVIVGFALLAVDASRIYVLQSSLQKGADAVALAMAAELDRGSDAITRAERARDNLVTNPALFTVSFSAVNRDSITQRYLRSLPASDNDPITSSHVTTDPALVRFVEVTVTPATYNTIFPTAVIKAVVPITATATSVAGLEAGACSVVPMFICNPLEPANNIDPFRITELKEHVANQALRRRLIELKSFANSGQSQYSPGNFGYVETPLGAGARQLSDAIAQVVPGACIALDKLVTKTGNTTVAERAFNVRFDMYSGSFDRGDISIRPAQNVRKSWTPAAGGSAGTRACRPTEVTDLYTRNPPYSSANLPAIGLPRDRCIVQGNCGSGGGGRVGGGDWNGMFELYMTRNFPSGVRPTAGPGQMPWSSTNLPSRYDVYKAEIAQGLVNNQSMATPACYNGGVAPSGRPDRRSLFAAIANCRAQPLGSGSTKISAVAIGQFFLTEPVGSSGSIYGEIVSIRAPGVGGGSDGVLVVDNVQLYR